MLADEVQRHDWYHTLELAPGVVTAGVFDHRPVLDRYPLPADLGGLRCLDVGTMDGFWAFEMERRGAREVVALDLEDPAEYDWPAALRQADRMAERKGERFALAREALGSRAERVLRSVYAMTPEDLGGTFDLVFCGDLLVHLKDPITAMERMLAVCSGSAVVCTPIERPRPWQRSPVARLDGIENFSWWSFTQPAFERLAQAAGFSRVEMARPFALPTTDGGWKGWRGALRAWP